MKLTYTRPLLMGLILLTGCGLLGKNKEKPVVRPVSHETPQTHNTPASKQIAIANGNNRDEWQDPSTLIPQPPDLPIDPIPTPTPPPRESANAGTPKVDSPAPAENLIIPANHVTTPSDAVAVVVPPPVVAPVANRSPAVNTPTAVAPAAEQDTPFQKIKALQRRASEQMAKISGFETKLTRQEVVNGKDGAEQVILMKFRTQPMSMHLKWIGNVAHGREMIYVAGRRNDVVDILTAKGDGFALTPAGLKKQFAPDDSTIRSQTRYDLREGGMQISINRLGEHLKKAEGQPTQMARFAHLGVVNRPERSSGLEVIEERITPGGEELFPRGGKRTTCFDPDPQSPSFGLPILVYAVNHQGQRVEYYFFDQLKPKQFSDADFDAKRLWK